MTTTFMSRDIPTILIDPDPDQPRKHFNRAAVDELAQSMQASGLASPILVRPVGERFLIVHGERRWRAAQSLAWETIPAIVQDIPADEAQWLALIENIQRADLTPLEEADAYQARLATGMTQEELGRRVGKSQSAIAQKLRLLTLPEPIALYLRRGVLTEGHARQLLKLRGWFHGMTRDIKQVDASTAEAHRQDLGDRAFVLVTTIAIRPEDQPAAALFPDEDDRLSLVADACAALWDMIDEHNGTTRLWHLHAFWWATFAVCFSASVADLGSALDFWHGRLLSAVGWNFCHRQDRIPAGGSPLADAQRAEYFGYRSDLRHAGLNTYIDTDTVPRDLILEAIKHMGSPSGYDFPSALQPWGTHADKAEELIRYNRLILAREAREEAEQAVTRKGGAA